MKKRIHESIQQEITNSSYYTQDMIDRFYTVLTKQVDQLTERRNPTYFGNSPVHRILEITASILSDSRYVDWCSPHDNPYDEINMLLRYIMQKSNIDISEYINKVDNYRGEGEFVSDEETASICDIIRRVFPKNSEQCIEDMMNWLNSIRNKESINGLYERLVKELPSYIFQDIADKYMELFNVNEPIKTNKDIDGWMLYVANNLAKEIKLLKLLKL